ncbi:response regulator [Paenibacillus cellulositrophicus]|uniref:Two-component system response regulator n=2 Tax=Paenibacillus TaxID=44249 RepID=A0A1R1ESB3_9BACL|nr:MULTISPECIES: response regulator transcription factor [Paenibacillus]MBJ9993218.1 response regulator transcription factor [Paenibacillus sp. S28]MCM2996402.1 response regulator transcription factor [Paenibacillus cellulositrophicus]MEC0175190.1 response regulator transcription factor [Paenibacillus favisporus]OMF54730.1 two-component system response regulator [Paenibacillus rhizosphaerae]OXL81941.1 two-component system response regulator [Paenibacillus sp. SSG-1]
MTRVWRVVIIDSHPTSMLGTKLILEERENLKVTGMASTWDEGLVLVIEHQPDLVLLDYQMPEGTAEPLLEKLKSSSPESHVLILTDHDGLKLLHPIIHHGGSGILSKQASASQLMLMIDGLREGFAALPIEWLKQGIWQMQAAPSAEGMFDLTETEIFIMERIVQGITYDKIATEITVSRRSIDNYLRKIYVKLGVSTRAQAIEKFALHSRQKRAMYI